MEAEFVQQPAKTCTPGGTFLLHLPGTHPGGEICVDPSCLQCQHAQKRLDSPVLEAVRKRPPAGASGMQEDLERTRTRATRGTHPDSESCEDPGCPQCQLAQQRLESMRKMAERQGGRADPGAADRSSAPGRLGMGDPTCEFYTLSHANAERKLLINTIDLLATFPHPNSIRRADLMPTGGSTGVSRAGASAAAARRESNNTPAAKPLKGTPMHCAYLDENKLLLDRVSFMRWAQEPIAELAEMVAGSLQLQRGQKDAFRPELEPIIRERMHHTQVHAKHICEEECLSRGPAIELECPEAAGFWFDCVHNLTVLPRELFEECFALALAQGQLLPGKVAGVAAKYVARKLTTALAHFAKHGETNLVKVEQVNRWLRAGGQTHVKKVFHATDAADAGHDGGHGGHGGHGDGHGHSHASTPVERSAHGAHAHSAHSAHSSADSSSSSSGCGCGSGSGSGQAGELALSHAVDRPGRTLSRPATAAAGASAAAALLPPRSFSQLVAALCVKDSLEAMQVLQP
jgi:hypothetical protein